MVYVYIVRATYSITCTLVARGTACARLIGVGCLGAKYCTPEVNTSEVIVDAQWHYPMDVQWHSPT